MQYIMFSYPKPEPVMSAYTNNDTCVPSKLGYATNNVYPQFPPRMNDGRSLIAAHQPEAVLNENLIKSSGMKSNWEYRKYLMENSQQIAKDNFREACNDCGYFERFKPNERGAEPLHYAMYKDNSTFIHEQSDLKQLYLSREDLSKKYEPITLTQDQLFSSAKGTKFP